jgi:hypothetical protein
MRTSVTGLEVRNHAAPRLALLRDRSPEHIIAEPYGNKARGTRKDRGSNLGEDAPPRHGAPSPNLAPPGPARSRGRRGQSGRGKVGRLDRPDDPSGGRGVELRGGEKRLGPAAAWGAGRRCRSHEVGEVRKK